MKSIELSYDQAVADLTALAQERPDYVYQEDPTTPTECMYFSPETSRPACIVGHLLSRHGFTLEDTNLVDTKPEDRPYSTMSEWNNGAGIDTLCRLEVIKVDRKTRVLLTQAQIAQDDGKTWSEALTRAVRAADYED